MIKCALHTTTEYSERRALLLLPSSARLPMLAGRIFRYLMQVLHWQVCLGGAGRPPTHHPAQAKPSQAMVFLTCPFALRTIAAAQARHQEGALGFVIPSRQCDQNSKES